MKQSGQSDKIYYAHNDHLGSILSLTDNNGASVFNATYDAWGRQTVSQNTIGFARGYTGHEHLPEFGVIDMNGRMYDALLGRFLSPDPCVQMPDFSQNFNRYSYCLNNPLIYTDPSGEFLIEAIIFGAMMNTFMQGASGNINSSGDFFKAMGIGALTGAAGYGAGQLVAGAVGTATTFGGAVLNGAAVGSAAGFAGGFVSGAGNSWAGGASFGKGLGQGIIGGGIGAAFGGVIGGVSGGIRFQKQIGVFQQGCSELNINPDDAIPESNITDKFLSDAQKVWYKDAPMNNVKAYTVENVPEARMTGPNGMVTRGASAQTMPLSLNKTFTGNSNVYFNKNLAFSSARHLFFTMGHEFVHVSQFASLAGQPIGLLSQPGFIDMLEFHAYSYQNVLGGVKMNSFTPDMMRNMMSNYPSYFNSLNYTNFGWTNSASFRYPF